MPPMPRYSHTAAHRRVARALRTARIDAGVLQNDLARKLRRPQSFISKVESGERRLDIVELALHCRALGVDFVQFVRGLGL